VQKSVTLRTLIAVYLAFLTTIFAHYFGTDVTQFRRPPQSNGASVSRRGGSLGPHLFIANANSGLYVGYLLMYAFIIICHVDTTFVVAIFGLQLYSVVRC